MERLLIFLLSIQSTYRKHKARPRQRYSLDIGQRLAGELQDVGGSAHEDQQQLRELVTSDPDAAGQKPLPHDQQDEHHLVQRQDPVVGTHRGEHLHLRLQLFTVKQLLTCIIIISPHKVYSLI